MRMSCWVNEADDYRRSLPDDEADHRLIWVNYSAACTSVAVIRRCVTMGEELRGGRRENS